MKIEQIYTGCLAQGAYYIVSNGEAAIVDPLREIQPYLDKAKKDDVKIKYILETHFHADFVSGHVDLAKATGATIIYGPTAKPAFEAHVAADNEILNLGNVTIQVMHTPGHTMESACFLLKDESQQDYALFSGDTLFIGDVGRPDLAQKAANLTTEQLAALLFHSLRNKIMPLADEIIVYPGHGAGSACGKNMSKETVSTIGIQKQTNYALRANMTEEEFVKEVTDGLLPPPAYFPQNAALNKNGYESVNTVLKRASQSFEVKQFEAAEEMHNALILDTRNASVFHKGFIPGSINIGLDGAFAPWLGALVPNIQTPILILSEDGKEEETAIRMARIGYDHIIGFLKGGFEAWKKDGRPYEQIRRIDAKTFETEWQKNNDPVFDVRKSSEFNAEHLEDAINIPLDFINDHLSSFPKEKHFYLHCAGGYRSMIAASILKSRGWINFTEIDGGFAAIKSQTALPKSIFQCQSNVS
jgi:glyoxylase-like metal-dependent hydrolase (beta-lactamase superfamily II)/rhodanese-related sulfurtransferase